jgi:hypothetical protein
MAKAHKPGWWNETHEGRWQRVKQAVVADWQKLSASAERLEQGVLERALSFGHGARAAYGRFAHFTADLERELRRDWREMHREAEDDWEHVRQAVKHGWERSEKPE